MATEASKLVLDALESSASINDVETIVRATQGVTQADRSRFRQTTAGQPRPCPVLLSRVCSHPKTGKPLEATRSGLHHRDEATRTRPCRIGSFQIRYPRDSGRKPSSRVGLLKAHRPRVPGTCRGFRIEYRCRTARFNMLRFQTNSSARWRSVRTVSTMGWNYGDVSRRPDTFSSPRCHFLALCAGPCNQNQHESEPGCSNPDATPGKTGEYGVD